MIDFAGISLSRLIRMRRDMHLSPLPDMRVIPPTAQQAGASDGLTLSRGPSSDPRVSAVEAGRHATQSDPGDECDCPACRSDCAGIVPCQRKGN
ncbi:hypothetical protein [Sphingomonas sp. VDB2]|uniref:hypothetical protein n=1 Tax=Sphingomonas sp. VDB2 TaxID=3228751 RepID=UPI003A7FB946